MNKYLKFAFIGGDLRQIRIIKRFAAEDIDIGIFGFDKYSFAGVENIKNYTELEPCIRNADIIVLPLPYGDEDNNIKTAFSDKRIHINSIMRLIDGSQILLVGKADKKLEALADLYNVHLIDYLKREEMTILNSIPTVEGALNIAMTETPYTIHGSNCLVLGYGRLGKLLSSSLKALGAVTAVAARKHSDLAWIKTFGYKPVPFKELENEVEDYNIIFNTVPSAVLDFKILSHISDKSLIVDLASRPGGVDFDTAAKLGKKVIWALSLPGKVAPDTAGDIMMDTIINIMEELGV